MESKFTFFVVLFLLAESATAGSEQYLSIQKRQAIRAQGCIAAGFTHCCASGACRVDLTDGGHCFCDRQCFYDYPHRNCCSDNPCKGLLFEKSNYFVGEGDGFVEVCGNLYGKQGLTVAVRFYTGSVTTGARQVFIGENEVLQMTSGERKCWNITILDDTIGEADVEQFSVHLSPYYVSVAHASARVYITDNDKGAPYSLLLLNNVYGLVCDGSLNHEVVEGDDPLEICVRISGSEGERVEVNVITVDGTATASQDYVASNQTLAYTTPEKKCIRIEILDDSKVEGDEQFWVYLTLPTNAGSEVLSRCGSVRIIDTDAPTLSQTSFTVDEGDGSVLICMHFGGEGLNITATITTSGTATRGSDYNFTTQSFLMYSGEKRCTSIEILDDAIVEKNTENIRVQFMTSPFSASLSDAYIWIQDNDAPAFESSYYLVGEGAGAVQVCMYLGGEALVDSVTLSTSDGSAKVGKDYSRTVQTFTVNSGERKCISIRILNDSVTESTMEYFNVQLSSTRYLPSSRYAIVLIQDNDGRDLVSTVEHQGQTVSGCIAAGFTRCCAFGTCRVDLPDGGHCFCDQECFTHAHHPCCSDNPCDVVRWEKMYYYASESDDSVEVCLQSGQTQGIAHAFSSTSPAHVPLDDWLRITPGGRKCWNITLQDDETFDLRDRSTHKSLYLWVNLYTSKSVQYYLIHSIVFIADDDRAPADLSLLTAESECRQTQFCTQASYRVAEGDQSTKLCKQLLGRGGVVGADLLLLDKTARAFQDYNGTNQSLLFRAGENCVDFEILDDLEVERTERFNAYLAIATATDAKVLHYCDYIYIHDNDAPTLEQTSVTVDERDGSVQVCMHFGGKGLTTRATFTIHRGSARYGSDYRGATHQRFVVNSGERRCITIQIVDDSVVESQEYLYVRLTTHPYSVWHGFCWIYITDNDGLTLSLNGFAYSVGESDGSVNVCVLGLGGTGSSSATTTISTQDISAISGSDYNSINQKRILRSGSTECVSISIINDTIQEPTEMFVVTLSASGAVRLENNTARVEIVDDDDINECLIDNGGCDQNCTNLPGSYSCSCTGGFTLDESQQMCNDINECQTGSHNCSAPAECVNFEGGFRCSCDTGYMLNGTTYANCEDIDECTVTNGGCAHTCNNTDGSFSCMCDGGYELDEDGRQCIDIDECTITNGGCAHTCNNTDGSFSCMCDEGYELDEDGRQCIGMTDQPTSAPSIPTCPMNQLPPSSNPCAVIQKNTRYVSQSGYYWIQGGNGAAVKVYCRMNSSSCCGITGDWMRVGYLDMKNASHHCPSGFHLYNSPRRCGLRIPRITGGSRRHGYTYKYDSAGCSKITYPTYSTRYQRVCGRITAYQKGTTDAFYNYYSHNSSISAEYVDGVSITHGSLKHHIWTFAAAYDELRADQWRCPCSRCDENFTGRVPSYVGNDYFCDSGTFLFPNPNQAYTTNPIWDGSGCAPTSTCCNFNFPPWFCKNLHQPTTDDIEVRVCRDQRGGDEDIQIGVIEIYIA